MNLVILALNKHAAGFCLKIHIVIIILNNFVQILNPNIYLARILNLCFKRCFLASDVLEKPIIY